MCWWICGGRSPPHLSNCPTHPAISQICPLCRLFTKSDPCNLFLVINFICMLHMVSPWNIESLLWEVNRGLIPPKQLDESIVMVGAAKLVNPDEVDWPPHWVPQRPRSPRAQLSRNQSHTFLKISKSNFSSNQVTSQPRHLICAFIQAHWAPVTPWEVQV